MTAALDPGVSSMLASVPTPHRPPHAHHPGRNRLRAAPRAILVALAVAVGAPAMLAAQDPSPRFGVWDMRTDRPAPYSNVMTYEPWGDGGMRITVATTNEQGRASEWGYATLFDGVFRPVDGQEGSDTAVEFVDDRTTRITNRRDGRVTQVIINTLSDDGNTISNEYVRFDDAGRITGVGHAVYERRR